MDISVLSHRDGAGSGGWRNSVGQSLYQHPRDHLLLWTVLLVASITTAGFWRARQRQSRARVETRAGAATEYVSRGPLAGLRVDHVALTKHNGLQKTPLKCDMAYVPGLTAHFAYFYVAYFRSKLNLLLLAFALGELAVNDNLWSLAPLVVFAALHAGRQTFAISDTLRYQTRRNARLLDRARFNVATQQYRVERVRQRDLARGDLVLVSRACNVSPPADLLLLRGALYVDESQAFGEDAVQQRAGVFDVAIPPPPNASTTATPENVPSVVASLTDACSAATVPSPWADLTSWLSDVKVFADRELLVRHRVARGRILGATAESPSNCATTTTAAVGVSEDATCRHSMTYEPCNVAFADTTVRDGAALGLVIETGGDCHVHRVAADKPRTKTDVQRRLECIGAASLALLVVLAACSGLVAHHRELHAHSFGVLFLLLALLLNSMIPLSLPFVLDCADVVLAQQLAAKHGGKLTFNRHGQGAHQAKPTEIVSDKTGTLTTNRVTLSHVLRWRSGDTSNAFVVGVHNNRVEGVDGVDGEADRRGKGDCSNSSGSSSSSSERGPCQVERKGDGVHCVAASELATEADVCVRMTPAVMACTGLLVAPTLGVVRSDVLDAELCAHLPCRLVFNGRLSGDSDDAVQRAARGPTSDETRWYTSGADGTESRLTRVRYRPFSHALGVKLAVTRASVSPTTFSHTLHVQGSPSAVLRYVSADAKRQLDALLEAAEALVMPAGAYRKILVYAKRDLGTMFSSATRDEELLVNLQGALVYVFADGMVSGADRTIAQILRRTERRFTMLSGDSRGSCLEAATALALVRNNASLANADADATDERTRTTALVEVRELADIAAAATAAAAALTSHEDGGYDRVLVLNGELLDVLTERTEYVPALERLLRDTRVRLVYRAPPQGKQQFVAFCQHRLGAEVLMLGDGANDASALRQADLGVAIRGGESSLAAAAAHVVVESCLEVSAFLDRCREPQYVVQVAAQWTLMRCMMSAFTNLTRLLLSDFRELQSRGAGGVGRLTPLLNASVFLFVMSYVTDETVAPANAACMLFVTADTDVASTAGTVETELEAMVTEVERRERKLSYARVLLKGVLLSVVDAVLVLPARAGDSRALIGVHILQLLLQLYTFKNEGWTRRSLWLHAAIVTGWVSWHGCVCGIRNGDVWAAVATWLVFLS